MEYFSDEFLSGLRTKSDGFQNEFEEIISDIDEYFDSEEEKKEFHEYIGREHSFHQSGNMLFSSKMLLCGKHTKNEHDKLCEKIQHFLFGLFDGTESDEAMLKAPHIIIAVSMPEDTFTEEDMNFLKNIISFERLSNGYLPAGITTISNDTSNGRAASCFVAALK